MITLKDFFSKLKLGWLYVFASGGYNKDIRKRNIPNAMNAASNVSIKKGVLVELPYLFSTLSLRIDRL
jgi:hypothetical protein